MALSLSAEQKSIQALFQGCEQYIIPEYQRPYSWEYDHCYQLYNDIISAYNREGEDYFIGNIIMAKATNDKQHLQLVDGQQRIVTIWVILRVLSVLNPHPILDGLLGIASLESDTSDIKIKSMIEESTDDEDLKSLFKKDKVAFDRMLQDTRNKQGMVEERKFNSRIKANATHFYNWFSSFFDTINNKQRIDFINFFLRNISLLPIELTGATMIEANDKALTIFETINNRGLNLEDADIFKARLYNKAKSTKEQKIFIEGWSSIRSSCESMKLSIDELFRYYSHIIRGCEGITTSETNLRDFFINQSFSPLRNDTYGMCLDALTKILESIKFYNSLLTSKTEATAWLQVIDAYSNQYPKIAIITYIYKNGLCIDKKLIGFIKSLIRYVYYQGSTTTVKFEIYTIIREIMRDEPINTYTRESVGDEIFHYSSRLKNGFALLAHYLSDSAPLLNYSIDSVVTWRDFQAKKLSEDWTKVKFEDIVPTIGNTVVLDVARKSTYYADKSKEYLNSEIAEVRHLFSKEFTYSEYVARNNKLKELVVSFFSNYE